MFIASLFAPPINTLSGFKRSLIAVPSARNSGLERISNVEFLFPDSLEDSRISFITSPVLTGSVLFSTTIVWSVAYSEICLADDSTHF